MCCSRRNTSVCGSLCCWREGCNRLLSARIMLRLWSASQGDGRSVAGNYGSVVHLCRRDGETIRLPNKRNVEMLHLQHLDITHPTGTLGVNASDQHRIGDPSHGQQVGGQTHRNTAFFAQRVDLFEGVHHDLFELSVHVELVPEERL